MSLATTHQGLQPTVTGHIGASLSVSRLFRSISTVLYTIYLTCASNIGDIILSSLLFAAINSNIAPWYSMGPARSINDILAALPYMFFWLWSNLFLFCLHNQKQPKTIAEDKLNKPWRPIPAGRLTSKQATQILYLMHPICFFIAWYIGGFIPYIVLTSFHLWYNELDGASNGIIKNIHNAVGIICFFGGPLEVATKHSVITGNTELRVWLALLTAAFATTCHTQDFRDMKGDLAAGRRTIPLAFGNIQSRILVAVAIAMWTPLASLLWGGLLKEAVLAYIAGAAVIGNLFLNRSTEGDILSWKLWSIWVLGLVMIPFLKTRADHGTFVP
ncbi:UbiA prenyltransferase family [Xylaria cubensis]|nr:UbiA prenyltransferase family [Xylaria cubensis]